MIIDFNGIQEMTMPCMNDGIGMMTVKMYNDENYRIIPTKIHRGGSIGLHTQNSGDDLNYIVSGTGKAICDGAEEELKAGMMHICLKGSQHTIINTGDNADNCRGKVTPQLSHIKTTENPGRNTG